MNVYYTLLPSLVDPTKTVEFPEYATEFSSGCDLRANGNYTLQPFERKLIPTGLKIQMHVDEEESDNGFGFVEAQVRSRSGMALKRGLIVLNSPGTIDEDYTGEIGVILCNMSNEVQVIEHGDRIAQLVYTLLPAVAVYELTPDEFDKLCGDSERGEGGFGSTGTN